MHFTLSELPSWDNVNVVGVSALPLWRRILEFSALAEAQGVILFSAGHCRRLVEEES
jgi:hypothetical protein